jgi:uncharacterized repeat protein (TIGR01451 family)
MRRVSGGSGTQATGRAGLLGARSRGLAVVVGLVCGVVGLLFGGVSVALAVGGGPQWSVIAVSAPTNFTPGDESGDDVYKVTVKNTGGASSVGPVTVSDVLPEGLTLGRAGVEGFVLHGTGRNQALSTPMRCEGVTCVYAGAVIPEETLVLTIPVDVELATEPVVTNLVRVSGGGAPDATVETPTVISGERAYFGIAPGSVSTALSSMQAGAHADLTTSIGFNTIDDKGTLAVAPKEVVVDLPPGFSGDLVETPTCAAALFSHGECPIGTQIGILTLTAKLTSDRETVVYTEPVYNLAPEPGDVAKLGFEAVAFDIQGDVTVRPGNYGLQARFQNIKGTGAELDSTSLTVWGVPADPIHDPWRWNPKAGALAGEFGVSSDNARVPYLSNPTSCNGQPLTVSVASRSWGPPEQEAHAEPEPTFGPLTGCDRLGLPSVLTAGPTTTLASAPTGLDVVLGVHQTDDNPEGLATSALQKAVVTLPEGMTVNPSAGAGLGACSVAQLEEEALEVAPGRGCPTDSKLGSVRIKTPALDEEATGSVFIAQPYQNPFNSLIALYVVARFPVRGVIVKVAGRVTPDPLTGQLVTTFEGIPTTFEGLAPQGGLPPVPFSVFTFSFRQGQTSPLVSPPTCGTGYAVHAELTPWSDPAEELMDASPPFEINQGFNGGACPAGGVPPFSPQVFAGTLDNDAGSYSPLEIRIVRDDGEQEITGFSSQLPPGLTASLSGVPFCSEAAIALARTKTGAQEEAEPSCPAASQIGHLLGGAGVGSVLAYAPGKIYMAGPFEGAPFSIAAIISAKVGPFDLGTVVVHLPLQINPVTAAVSVPAGASDQIPHIIKGIVIHVRDIQVYIDRPNFTLNPTSCAPMSFAATVIGSGASFTNPEDDDSTTITDPFQAADCQNLAFKPGFAVSTSGKTSKANGASLTAKLTYPNAPQGTQANIARVKVDLPKQLPSRLTTLQKACTAAQFNTNPAGCPAASVVGHAKAITPILPVPLEGPAYFVSHGGEAFPSLIVVLQGYGVTIDLIGTTFISKAGITSSTFKTVPDQPVTSFELTLPEGKYSALAANGNLCKTKLAMPTEFVAQNGAVIHQSTKITATGCPKRKALTTAQKLAAALKACRRQPRHERVSCEAQAHKRYRARAKTKGAVRAGRATKTSGKS